MTDMPKRIWAYIGLDGPAFDRRKVPGYDYYVEYIRADSIPDVDTEHLAHEVRDAVFRTFAVNLDPAFIERALRLALGGNDD